MFSSMRRDERRKGSLYEFATNQLILFGLLFQRTNERANERVNKCANKRESRKNLSSKMYQYFVRGTGIYEYVALEKKSFYLVTYNLHKQIVFNRETDKLQK